MTAPRLRPLLTAAVVIGTLVSLAPSGGPALADSPAMQQKPVGKTPVDPLDPAIPADAAQQGRIQVALSVDQIMVNGEATTLDGFAAAVKAAAGEDPGKAAVQFKCAGEVPVGRVYEVQQQMQGLGMKKVMYGGKEGGRVPMALPSPQSMAKLKSLPPQDVLELKVRAGRKISVDGVDTPPAKVEELVRRRVTDNPKLVVSLTMAPDTTFKELTNVLEQLQSIGAERVAMNEPAM